MYGKILVPLDGSAASLRSLREAIKLAKQQGGRIRVLYVVTDLVTDYSAASSYTGALLDALRRAGQDILHSAESDIRAEGVDAELRLIEAIGRTAAISIVEQARQWPADLIVMGTHGRRGLSRLALGSDAENVLRTSPVPVLLVRADSATD